jgi:hypothetical protein
MVNLSYNKNLLLPSIGKSLFNRRGKGSGGDRFSSTFSQTGSGRKSPTTGGKTKSTGDQPLYFIGVDPQQF